MLILFLLFIIQFSIACACLAVTTDQQHQIALEGWRRAKLNIKIKTQTIFRCYGFENQTFPPDDSLGGGVPYQNVRILFPFLKIFYCNIEYEYVVILL